MSNFLGDCETIELLSLKRNNLIAEINKEFMDKRKELSERTPRFKPIQIIDVPVLKEPMPIYSSLPYTEGEVASNMIEMKSGKPIAI